MLHEEEAVPDSLSDGRHQLDQEAGRHDLLMSIEYEAFTMLNEQLVFRYEALNLFAVPLVHFRHEHVVYSGHTVKFLVDHLGKEIVFVDEGSTVLSFN